MYAELFVSLQEQPERKGANYIFLGNSTFTSPFGYAIDLRAVVTVIPACNSCLNSILLNKQGVNMDNNNGCTNCSMWTMNLNPGELDFPPPKEYPYEAIPSSGKCFPIKMSYTSMSRAVETANYKFVDRLWTSGNVG